MHPIQWATGACSSTPNKTYLDGILSMKNYKNTYYSVCLYIKFPCCYVLFHESYIEFCGFLCRLEPGAPGSEPEPNLPNPNLGVWVQVQKTTKLNPWVWVQVQVKSAQTHTKPNRGQSNAYIQSQMLDP